MSGRRAVVPRGDIPGRCPRTPWGLLIVITAMTLASVPVGAAALVTEENGTDEARVDEIGESLDIPLSVAFYADTSCLLTIDRRARVGRTLIDATLGDNGSRTLIHCDTENGQRLTVLARGVTLGRYERMPLLARASIDDGAKGVIAWLTRAGTTFPDESAPRRYVTRGNVFVTETPQVKAAGTTLNVDHLAFARVEGFLEKLLEHPGEAESANH